MIRHDVSIYPEAGNFTAKCTCGGLNKKYPSRDQAFSTAHLHIAGLDIDLIELALAGKEAHA